jgi:hypothetical protein
MNPAAGGREDRVDREGLQVDSHGAWIDRSCFAGSSQADAELEKLDECIRPLCFHSNPLRDSADLSILRFPHPPLSACPIFGMLASYPQKSDTQS